MRTTGIALTAIAVLIAGTAVFVAVTGDDGQTVSGTAPHLVSMQESGQAMQQAGEVMQTHGKVMLDEGQRTADQKLWADGEHWLSDGQALIQGGRWMAQNPTSPGSLVSSQSELEAQGSYCRLG